MNFNFPQIPSSKLFSNSHTLEQKLIFSAFKGKQLLNEDIKILEDCSEFYQRAFSYLSEIDLSEIDENDKIQICEYLTKILNPQLVFQNQIEFSVLFRVSIIQSAFLTEGRVKSLKFLQEPPLQLISKIGRYGRCNSDRSTRFYASADPYTAILETKPGVGDRIILTRWKNVSRRKFTVFPLTNTSKIQDFKMTKATDALSAHLSKLPPPISNIILSTQEFFSDQFVKNSPQLHPKRYEYLFSAFFSDLILDKPLNIQETGLKGFQQFDGIIYPSVACEHQLENFVLTREAARDLIPDAISEYLVAATEYSHCNIEDAKNDLLPISAERIRYVTNMENDMLTWNDETVQDY